MTDDITGARDARKHSSISLVHDPCTDAGNDPVERHLPEDAHRDHVADSNRAARHGRNHRAVLDARLHAVAFHEQGNQIVAAGGVIIALGAFGDGHFSS